MIGDYTEVADADTDWSGSVGTQAADMNLDIVSRQ